MVLDTKTSFCSPIWFFVESARSPYKQQNKNVLNRKKPPKTQQTQKTKTNKKQTQLGTKYTKVTIKVWYIGQVVKSSANGLVGTGFVYWYQLQPR